MKGKLLSKQFESTKIIHCLYFLVCLGFCLYQICTICEIYFSYKTTTFVKYENISKISLPAITVCVDKREVIPKEFLTKHNIPSASYEFLAKLPVKEQFEGILGHHQIFNRCMVHRPIAFAHHFDHLYIDCSDITPIRTSIDYDRICFTHFAQPANETDISKYIIENNFVFNDYLKFMVIFDMKVNVSQLYLKVHSREDVLDNYMNEDFIKVTNKINAETGMHMIRPVHYRRFITYSLPNPYETQCFDYRTEAYTSPRDCIDGCRQREERKLAQNEWPGNYLNYDNQSNELMSNMLHILHQNMIKDLEIGQMCKHTCELHPECYGEMYEMEVGDKELFFDHLIIPIFPPKMPDLVYSHQPAMLFEEFLSYLGSYISFWFGVSAIMLSNLLVRISNKIYVKTKSNNLFVVNTHINSSNTLKENWTNNNRSNTARHIYFEETHHY